MKAAKWIDQVKAKKGLSSDYAAAKLLGITTSTVSWYRRVDDKTLDEDTAVKVAQALGIEAARIVIDQAAERSKDPEVRATLSRFAEAQSVYYVKLRRAIQFVAACAIPMRATA